MRVIQLPLRQEYEQPVVVRTEVVLAAWLIENELAAEPSWR
jgi:hypothetical protein